MSFNTMLKGFALAFSIFALAACSTTEDAQTGQAQTETNKQEEVVVEAEPAVEVEPAEPVLTPEQEQEMRYAELRKAHTIYFDFDQSDIRGEFAELLQAHAAYLRNNGNVRVLLEGHADERGTPEYNIALGERRAKSVAQYLMGLGVLESQIYVVSYGEEKPLDPRSNEEAWSKNRRAVLVY